MKIKYEFVNETVEIEVSEEWATIIADLDRHDYNTDHKETRRHCSLEAYNLDDALLPSDEDVEGDFIRAEEDEVIHRAVDSLSADQADLIKALYFNGVSVNEYARMHGVSQSAISHRKELAIKKLKNFCNGPHILLLPWPTCEGQQKIRPSEKDGVYETHTQNQGFQRTRGWWCR